MIFYFALCIQKGARRTPVLKFEFQESGLGDDGTGAKFSFVTRRKKWQDMNASLETLPFDATIPTASLEGTPSLCGGEKDGDEETQGSCVETRIPEPEQRS